MYKRRLGSHQLDRSASITASVQWHWAARRAYRQLDIPAWGMAVEPEDGKDNPKLWAWYESVNFIPAKTLPKLMYATFASLIPELS
jgi:hypothetical protein